MFHYLLLNWWLNEQEVLNRSILLASSWVHYKSERSITRDDATFWYLRLKHIPGDASVFYNHSIKSYVFVSCMILLGGHTWFSYRKKASISLSPVLHDMYILEKNWTSACGLEIIEVNFAGIIPGLEFNKRQINPVYGVTEGSYIIIETRLNKCLVLCYTKVFCSSYMVCYDVGHYHIGIKIIEICDFIRKPVPMFFNQIRDTLYIR